VSSEAQSDFARQMMGLHKDLELLFREHQFAIMRGDYSRARKLFAIHAETLRAHAEDEEAHILPVFAERGGEDLDSPPRLFLGEHQKIRAFLDEIDLRLAALGDGDSLGALELLDREAWFKNLLMHHDLREGNVLYPKVDEWTSPEERAEILTKLKVKQIPSWDRK
jgi:hemerythrin-like domain-containing protein